MGSNTNKWFVGQPYEMNPHEVKYDTKITSFNAQKSEEDYQAMKLLIAEQGQQKPCLLREGLMGDGVNRTKAAKELGRMLLVIDVDPAMPDVDYIALCNADTMSTRKYTPTQWAIMAYKLVKLYGYTDKKASMMVGLKDRNAIGQVRYIADTKYKKLLDDLFEGTKVSVTDSNGEVMYTGVSLKWIKSAIARIAEKDLLEVDISEDAEELVIDYNLLLKTETAKTIFFEKYVKSDLSIEVKQYTCTLLNLMFKYKDAEKAGVIVGPGGTEGDGGETATTEDQG